MNTHEETIREMRKVIEMDITIIEARIYESENTTRCLKETLSALQEKLIAHDKTWGIR
jgi:hypothetical protein